MNDPEQTPPQPIDPDLEARIAALVLGEASDLERDQLRRLIEQRPELAALRKELERTHGLLQEIGSGEWAAEDDDWKLPDERRSVVLATIRGETPPTADKSLASKPVAVVPTFKRHWIWSVSGIAAVFLLIGTLLMPARQAAREVAGRAPSATTNAPLLAVDSVAPPSGRFSAGSEFDESVMEDAEMADSATGFAVDSKSSLSAIEESIAEIFAEPETSSAVNGVADLSATADLEFSAESGYGVSLPETTPARPQSPVIGFPLSGTMPSMGRTLGWEDDGAANWSAPRPGAVAGGGQSMDMDTGMDMGMQFNDQMQRQDQAYFGGTVITGASDYDVAAGKQVQAKGVPAEGQGQSGGGGMGGGGMGGGMKGGGMKGGGMKGFGSTATMRGQIVPHITSADPDLSNKLSVDSYQAGNVDFSMDLSTPRIIIDEEESGGLALGNSEFDSGMGGAVPSHSNRSRTLDRKLEEDFEQLPSQQRRFYGESRAGERFAAPGIDDLFAAESEPKDLQDGVSGPQPPSMDGAAIGSRRKRSQAVPSLQKQASGGVNWGFSPDAAEQRPQGMEMLMEGEEANAEPEPEIVGDFAVRSDANGDRIPLAYRENAPYYFRSLEAQQQGQEVGLSDQRIELGVAGKIDSSKDAPRQLIEPRSTSKPKSKPKSKALGEKEPAPVSLNETLAEQQPFSTFSLHVGDVSFKLAHAALVRGEWPEAAKIRIEEFVNAFDYGDPMPSSEEKVACRLEQSAHPFLQQRNLLRVAMRTAAAGRASSTPLRLTLLLDNSGSMERSDRQQTVRRAFALLTAQLKPIDRVTLISFARRPRLLADQVGGDRSQHLVSLVERLPSEGGTNIEAALQLAFEKAMEQQVDGAQNRIILLTDGAVNLGDADPESLSRIIATMRGSGIAFDAAGICAEGLNDEVLEALTRKGDGRYYLLDSADAADDGFARQIAGALRPSAKNVKVQIEFNPNRVGRYRLLGFEKHRLNKEDFRNDKVDAAEMAAAEAGVAVYQIEAKPDGVGDIGSVSVRFRDLSSGRMIENRWPIPYEADAPRIDQAAPSMRVAAVAALLAAKLRGESLGASVDLKTLSQLVAALPRQNGQVARVQQLQAMIEQARQLSGG